jgi:hypothetical protein
VCVTKRFLDEWNHHQYNHKAIEESHTSEDNASATGKSRQDMAFGRHGNELQRWGITSVSAPPDVCFMGWLVTWRYTHGLHLFLADRSDVPDTQHQILAM